MISYSGIGTYLRNLLSEILTLPGEERYILFGKDAEIKEYLREDRSQKATWNSDPYNPLSLWMHSLKGSGIDVYHCPHYNLPFGVDRPSIVTIHDLIPFVRPDLLTNSRAHWYASWMLPSAVRRASHILTVSESSKGDIIRHLRVSESKITVTYHGVGGIFHPLPKDVVEEFRLSRRMPQRFILFVGLLKPHKNIVRLLQAFASLQLEGISLLLVGRRDNRYHELNKALATGSLGRNIVLLSSIPFEDLPNLYNAAECLVLPSLYEGFGLPALEALACGTPVVCSQATSLPEVVGDAGVLVDPLSVRSIALGIRQAFGDHTLRAELRDKGLERAKKFRWSDAATETLEVYRRVADR